jgi:Domain of unknown function (DUF4169)
MGETVNLRQWKKRRDRSDSEAAAAQNRTSHGLPKVLKQELRAQAAKSAALLESKKLDPKGLA